MVEVVLNVEEAFEITIEDNELYNVLTPKDFIDVIETKVLLNENKNFYLTQRIFYIIRKIAIDEFKVNRKDFKPDSNF